MSRKRLKVNATEEQIKTLYAALSVGSPITIALQMAGISLATFYYWVAIYSVVVYIKEQEELEAIEELAKTGISIQEIKEMSAAASEGHRKMSIGNYIEPKQETILQYRNSNQFRKFANEIYDIITKCNQIRSKVVVKHLDNITKSTDSKNRIKASGSMWFLERTQADYFGRASDKVIEQENTSNITPSVTVEFINPETDKQRLEDMETLVLKELKGSGDA